MWVGLYILSSVDLFLLQVGILEGVYHLAMAEEVEEHLPNMTDAMANMPNVSCYCKQPPQYLLDQNWLW